MSRQARAKGRMDAGADPVVAEWRNRGIIDAIDAASAVNRPFTVAAIRGDGELMKALVSPCRDVALIADRARQARGGEYYKVAYRSGDSGDEAYTTTFGSLWVKDSGLYACFGGNIHQVSADAGVVRQAGTRTRPRIGTVLPNGMLLSWDSRALLSSDCASGSYATGFPAEIDGDRVFVKGIRSANILALNRKASDHLARRSAENPELAQYLSQSFYIGRAEGLPKAIASASSTGGVVVDQRIDGLTLAQWRDAGATFDDPLMAHQVAAIGLLTTRGLAAMNQGAAPEDRVVAPDFCKPDNIMVPATAIDTADGDTPHRIVFVDKDSLLRQGDPGGGSILGHPHFTPCFDIYEMEQRQADGSYTRDYAQADRVHAFQVGRLMYDLSGLEFPSTQAKPNTAKGMADMFVECNRQEYSDRCMATYRQAYGHDGAWGRLGDIMERCMQIDAEQRPTLADIEAGLADVVTSAGHRPPTR